MKALLSFLFIILVHYSNSQTGTKDNLNSKSVSSKEKIPESIFVLSKLKVAKHDTERCNILIDLIDNELNEIQFKKYNDQLFDIANKNLKTEKVRTVLYVFYKKCLSEAYNNYCVYYDAKGDYKIALGYTKKCLELLTELDDKYGKVVMLNNLGAHYQRLNDYSKALSYLLQGLKEFKRLKDTSGIENYYQNISEQYFLIGDIRKALQYDLEALAISQKNKNQKAVSFSLNHMSVMYRALGDIDKSIEYCLNGLKIRKQIGYKRGESESLWNLAVDYIKKNDTNTAYKYLLKSLDISREIKDKMGIARALGHLGEVFLMEGNYVNALQYSLNSLDMWKEIGEESGMVRNLTNIGMIYVRNKNYVEALKYLTRSLEVSMKLGLPEGMRTASKGLVEVYRHEQNFSKAFEMQGLYIKMNDSLNNDKLKNDVMRAEMQFEFRQKQAFLKAEQDKKDILATERIKRSQLLLMGSFILLALVIIIAILFFSQNKLRNDQQRDHLEQKLMRSQMNPHFIFNSLQAIQNFILKNDTKEAVKYLSSFASITRAVLENSIHETISLQKEITLLEQYLQLQKLRYNNLFDYTITLSPQVDPEAIVIPPMLAQPFIENAIEHGMSKIQSGGLISISYSKDNSNLYFEIKDNGAGISTKSSNKEHHSRAMSITKERISLLNKNKTAKTSFVISKAYPNEINEGVKVSFSIPI